MRTELLKESLWLWDLAALFCPWVYDQRQILTRQCRILNNILALKTYSVLAPFIGAFKSRNLLIWWEDWNSRNRIMIYLTWHILEILPLSWVSLLPTMRNEKMKVLLKTSHKNILTHDACTGFFNCHARIPLTSSNEPTGQFKYLSNCAPTLPIIHH